MSIINIPMTPETEAKLREVAMAAGMDISSYILKVLQQKLSDSAVATSPGDDSLALLQGLDERIWNGVDPVEYQRKEREGWD